MSWWPATLEFLETLETPLPDPGIAILSPLKPLKI